MKFLVCDSGGLNIGTAQQLGKEGHEVYYWTPWVSSYPKFEAFAPGVGVKEVNKIMDWGLYVDGVDCIVFPDVGMGGMANYLRKQGYCVFGAGLGEDAEQDRKLSVDLMNGVGIKCPETHVAKGLNEAITLLKDLLGGSVTSETNQNAKGRYFVKFNVWRGSLESFPADSVDQVNYMFDTMRTALGPYANEIPVIIQKKVEGIETGFDCFFNGKDWIKPGMWGFESGGDYVGYITDDLSFFDKDMQAIKPWLQEVDYRGAFSMETIWDGKDHYWLDFTTRLPMPLGLMYCTFAEGLGQFICDVAAGKDVEAPFKKNQYMGCMQVSSEEAMAKYLPLKGGKDTRFVRFMEDSKGDYYSVPGCSLLGVSSGLAPSLKELEEKIQKESETLSIYFATFNPGFLHDVQDKYIAPLAEQDIQFGDNPTLESFKKPAIRDGIEEESGSRASDLLKSLVAFS